MSGGVVPATVGATLPRVPRGTSDEERSDRMGQPTKLEWIIARAAEQSRRRSADVFVQQYERGLITVAELEQRLGMIVRQTG